MIAFSVYTNGEKIFKCNRSKSANMMECINGIRVLSIVWVVFGHTYFTFLLTPTSNLAVMGKVGKIDKRFEKQILNQICCHLHLSTLKLLSHNISFCHSFTYPTQVETFLIVVVQLTCKIKKQIENIN